MAQSLAIVGHAVAAAPVAAAVIASSGARW